MLDAVVLFCACLTHWCRDCDTSASQLYPKELSRLLSLQQLPELLKTLKDCRKQTIYLLSIYCFICFFCFWRVLLILSVDLYSGWHRLTSILSSSFHLRMQQAKVSPRSLEVLHLYMMIVYSCFKSKLQYSIHELYTDFGQTWWFLATSTRPWSTCYRLDWQTPSVSDRPSHRAAPLQQHWGISQAWHRYPDLPDAFATWFQCLSDCKLRQLCASIIMLHLAFLVI